MTLPWQATKGGLRLAVKLTPRAVRASVEGLVQDAQGRPLLSIKVSSPPVDGGANHELVKFIAKALGLRQEDIYIVSGEGSRIKILRLAGDPAILADRMKLLIG